jgi:hypothetical protein
MPDPTFSNPYPKPAPGATAHEVVGKVSHADYYFLKQRLPMVVGLTDKIISTLYKSFIDELRSIESTTPIEPGWYVDSDTHKLIASVLYGISFTGRAVGQAPARDDERGTGSVHQGHGGEAIVGADEESKSGQGGNGPRSEAQGKEKRQRRERVGGAGKSE